MSSITAVKTKDRTSSAGQKFWPLKKFGLHHGKTEEQSITLTTTNTIKPTVINEPAKGIKINNNNKNLNFWIHYWQHFIIRFNWKRYTKKIKK